MFRTTRGFRRAWFRGLRADDVTRALDQLEQRNTELERKLGESEATTHALADRLTAAEETLRTFESTVANIASLLSLAQDRARQMEQEAYVEAARIRAEAEQHAREVESQIAALAARKQQILDELVALHTSLTAVAEGIHPSPATNVHALPGRGTHHMPQAGAGA